MGKKDEAENLKEYLFETLVLGAACSSHTALNNCCNELTEDHFVIFENRVLWQILYNKFYKEDKEPNTISIGNEISQHLNEVLADSLRKVANLIQASYGQDLDYSINELKRYSFLRKVGLAAGKLTALLECGTMPIKEMRHRVGEIFSSLEQKDGTLKTHKISDSANEFLLKIEESVKCFRETGKPLDDNNYVKTGIDGIDNITHGFIAGGLIILGSRPAMGKTALALEIMLRTTIKNRKTVGFFSLEMPESQIVTRCISSVSEVPNSKITQASINDWELEKVKNAIEVIKESEVLFFDKITSLTDLVVQIKQLKNVHGVDLIIIDYLQLITHTRRFENRQTEISNISQTLKGLALALKIPIFALAQLSRKVEERERKIPYLSDLRESGSLEQDADVVLLLNRKDYYDAYDRPGQAQLIVAKNRHGPTGEVNLRFDKTCGKFAE